MGWTKSPVANGCAAIVLGALALTWCATRSPTENAGRTSHLAELTGTPTPPPSARPIEATAADLARAYDRNEVGADQRFRGKRVRVSGTVEKIGKGVDDSPYVILAGSGSTPVECVFDEASTPPEVGKLRPGKWVQLEGTGTGLTIGIAGLGACALIQCQTN